MTLMTRGELSNKTGVSTATIRYYEDQHILPSPKRSPNGYRMYTEDYLIKLKFIQDAKSLGYSLKEIREIMEMLRNELDPTKLKTIVHNKMEEIEDRINRLREMRNLLANLLETSDQEIQDYMQSFRVRNHDEQ
ncbi:MerR family transcriptional regulator [Gracilibacillus sp. S3-1-1]|uniref:MerR family transcriptional regulator n=1 Tax=Gracilibacillus pellucidus TaxID=3095368 RepID=A0ACC6M890_9BACI|nr:MerR family transcriptional regulator [Gracilibacillus sp. S3-1-1]MDX8047203.1 MerR family transcriptional regulator [Gracilibacillus sp. S3-1-1]